MRHFERCLFMNAKIYDITDFEFWFISIASGIIFKPLNRDK